MRIYLSILALFCFYLVGNSQEIVTYLPSTIDFVNPERGFYRYSETRSGNYSFLNQSALQGYRQLHTPPTANYSIYSSLVFRYFFLEDFKISNISQTYLDNMQTDFNTARAAGVKIIPRFIYTDEVDGSGCSSWICPPYGDASKVWILTHINQIASILEMNKDVIASVQMGFVGVWGENYYTDYFGDASQGPANKLLDNNWMDRTEVLNALLAAVPAERMVQVRYPQLKQRAIYGTNAPTTAASITFAEAYNGTSKSRLGFHNDCLLASADDFGTYTDYGNSSSNSMSDTTNLKPYMDDESKFVVVGGETCGDDYSPQNDCAASNVLAYGDTELERMHYSYLNAQFNNDVNNDWITGNCIDDIKKRLGYRFELQEATFSNTAQPNQVVDIDISLKNVGYASPFNRRGLEIILRNTSTAAIWKATLTADPRYWFAGSTIYDLDNTLCIPSNLPLGTYEVLLNLPDPMPSLETSSLYSIRLANLLPDNSEVWESITGYNKLGHTITIDNNSSNASCNGEITFTSLSVLPVELMNFRAFAKDNYNEIKWQTRTEQNNAGFNVERSLDGINFNSIVWRKGNGTTNKIHDYQMIDKAIIPNTSYYYRLAQQDFDGNKTYSEIINLRSHSNINLETWANSIQVYPNPIKDMVTIDWAVVNLEVELRVMDILNKEVIKPINNTRELDFSHLPKGIYFLYLSYQNRTVVKKLVKG